MIFVPRFDAAEIIRLLPRANVMMGVPTFYTRLLDYEDFTRASCDAIRLFVSGSAPLLAETSDAFFERTGHRVLERYGMTETGMNTSNPLDGARIAGSVGPPLPGVAVRVCNEDGKTLAAGEIGELEVRGPNVFQGYWRKPDKTAESFREVGFFRTGDIGVIDDTGYVSIVGCAKDLIISGGLNIYPKEIETILNSLDGIRESAVVGVPHPDFGEAVLPVVVPESGFPLSKSEVIDQLQNRLAGFKRPKEMRFVDELPRNAMGKVMKNLIRDDNRNLFA